MQTASHHIERALSLLQLRKPDLAMHEAQRALELEPDSAEAHECMAWVLRALKRLDAAREAALTALRHDPHLGDGHLVLALLFWQQGQLLQARRAFAEANRLQNGDVLFLADMYARFLDTLNERPQALEVVQACLARFPNAARLHTRHGVLLAQTSPAEAETAFREALRLDPRQQEAHTGMGRLHLAARRSAEALASFREALRLDPHNDEARAGLVQALKARNAFYGGALALLLSLRRKRNLFANLSKTARLRWSIALLLPLILFFSSLGLEIVFGHSLSSLWLLPVVILYFGSFAVFLLVVALANTFWKGLIEPLFNLLLLFDPANRDIVEIELGSTLISMLSGLAVLTLIATVGAAALGAPDSVGVPLVTLVFYLGGMAALARGLLANKPNLSSPRWFAFGSVGVGGGITLLFVAFEYVRDSLQLSESIFVAAPVVLLFGFSLLLFLLGLVLTLIIWIMDVLHRRQERQLQTGRRSLDQSGKLVPLHWQFLLMIGGLVGLLFAVALAEASPPLGLLVGGFTLLSVVTIPMLINPVVTKNLPLFHRLIAESRRRAAIMYGAGLLLLLLCSCGLALLSA